MQQSGLEGPGFFFDRAALRATALTHRDAWRGAEPFRHAVIDNFLGEPLARALAQAYPGPEHPGWLRRDYEEQAARLGQLQRIGFEGVHGAVRHLLAEFSGMAFLDFLEALTGIKGLIADPHFRGGGLQLTLRGGHLGLHADFNRDRFRALTRRLTVMYYLNPDWQPEWGGDLELWNADLSACGARIAPLLDRLVVMEQGDDHWHGYPTPVECPADRGRCAVATYFYTAEDSPEAPAAHSALWAARR